MKQKYKLAFSLIELSIVILIIGILVIGISKGSRIIANARLTSARTLTKSSPVNLNADKLALWLETTSESSFKPAQAINNASVTDWFDINPSPTNGAFNVAAISTPPLYITNVTNNLPALRFNNSPLEKPNIPASLLTHDGNQITIFLVQRYTSYPAIASPFFWSNGSNRIGSHTLNGDILFFDMGLCCTSTERINFNPPSTFRNRANIITYIRRPNFTGMVRINGKDAMTVQTGLTDFIPIGLLGNFDVASDIVGGDINELIIFRVALKDSEIAGIEQYLGSKWGIKLTGL